ncbi:VOC family protein [Dysgonomonas sp. HDW5A]|uniref:VOC family protein n=1 Tax=Dysgonomonas sp. HDW5A TaxID=2714926 RepID=UPI001407A1D2|nr:VOC family protein [Dysgonomonas sp. HDW5A]QIK60272.1 VOC family protein [Dysgonomonas sp. HDW5A]
MKNLTPYLIINNKCEEALLFYKDCFDGEISFMQRYAEAENYNVSEQFKDKIAHAEFMAEGIKFYASDGFEGQEVTVGDTIAMTVSFDNEKEQKTVFDKLKVGGNVTMDFAETSTDSILVTLIDKYGIHWYLNYDK